MCTLANVLGANPSPALHYVRCSGRLTVVAHSTFFEEEAYIYIANRLMFHNLFYFRLCCIKVALKFT